MHIHQEEPTDRAFSLPPEPGDSDIVTSMRPPNFLGEPDSVPLADACCDHDAVTVNLGLRRLT